MPFHNNSRGGMKRLNPKNKGKRNTAESHDGSGDTIGKTNPVDKKSFSVKTIDVNQDLMLSDEDEDSEDDQKFSPTKSFKVKLVSKELWHFRRLNGFSGRLKGLLLQICAMKS
jgi:hypothetical protein